MWQQLKYMPLWLRRVLHCRGFGIQSPTDYAFVRYVINEHWPYYQYRELGHGDDWLTRKLGRLYFRLSNWRQPAVIVSDRYADYLAAGCRRARLVQGVDGIVELARFTVEQEGLVCQAMDNTDSRSLLVVEGIGRRPDVWRRLVDDPRSRVTFDLYYCGIVTFDNKRTKQHYIINF
jgi:hypothetical protein